MLHHVDDVAEDATRSGARHVHDVRHQLQQRQPVGPGGDALTVEQQQARPEESNHAQNADEKVQRHVPRPEPHVVRHSWHAQTDVTAACMDDALQARGVMGGGERRHRCCVGPDLPDNNVCGCFVTDQHCLESGWEWNLFHLPVAGNEWLHRRRGCGRRSCG